ncbi:MAG: hypothetical protein ACYDDE_03920 [bacterium]
MRITYNKISESEKLLFDIAGVDYNKIKQYNNITYIAHRKIITVTTKAKNIKLLKNNPKYKNDYFIYEKGDDSQENKVNCVEYQITQEELDLIIQQKTNGRAL